jgi:23S rRNA (cytosine1962-C5)-methyltransferase
MPRHFRPEPPRDARLCWIDSQILPALAAEGTDAHRLASGGTAWIERLGQDLLISHQDAPSLDSARAELARWRTENALEIRRVFARFVPVQNEERIAPVLLEGDAALPPTGMARELGLRYSLSFAAGYSTGLFLDQRGNRRHLRALGPRRLLNTFAYTCAFSVAAAALGAETVSIDLSRKWLDRGRENFALNALDAAGHRFIADDVLDVLPRLVRRGEKFDAVIIDPPTFARGRRSQPFRVEDDLPGLIATAFELTSPGANILVSTNCTRLTPGDLEFMATTAAREARRLCQFHREPPLPDVPAANGPSTLWIAA